MDNNCKKVVSFVKTSDSPSGLPNAHSLPHAVELDALVLEGAYNYIQSKGKNPPRLELPPYYERIELVTAGRGWIQDEGTWREVVPGDLIWNRPGQQTIGRSDFDNPYRCLAVTLVTHKKSGLGIPRYSHWAQLKEVVSFSREVVNLFGNESCDRSVLRNYLVSNLLLRVELHHHKTGWENMPDPVRKVLEWMEVNYLSPCKIQDLAKIAGWSPPYLHDAFQRHLHTTPHQIIMRLRLRAVCERLVSTTQPIKQIAVECGFTDASTLAHAFKSGMGVTPKAYRQRYMHLVIDDDPQAKRDN
ncbi:MAG: AraC family transcriptional regulator [Chthoniobacterales bacterium]